MFIGEHLSGGSGSSFVAFGSQNKLSNKIFGLAVKLKKNPKTINNQNTEIFQRPGVKNNNSSRSANIKSYKGTFL